MMPGIIHRKTSHRSFHVLAILTFRFSLGLCYNRCAAKFRSLRAVFGRQRLITATHSSPPSSRVVESDRFSSTCPHCVPFPTEVYSDVEILCCMYEYERRQCGQLSHAVEPFIRNAASLAPARCMTAASFWNGICSYSWCVWTKLQ